MLITIVSCQAASEETTSGSNSWELVFSGQKIDDFNLGSGGLVSPDNTRVAYTNVSKGLSVVVAGPEGKTEGKVYDYVKDIVFSPNSTRVAYYAQIGDKWTAVIDGSEGKQYDSVLQSIATVIFSPDSKRAAYRAFSGNKTAVVVDGEENLYDSAGEPIFSPDSQHLAYTFSKDGKSGILLDGQELEPSGGGFIFSPDSNRWAYGKGSAYIGDPTYIILNNKILDLGTDNDIYGMYFSPDSQKFAFTMRIGPNTYGFQRVVVDEVYGKKYPFPGVGKVVFSPDSQHVAYWAKSEGEGYFLVLEGVEGKNYSEVRDPIFSPDSNHTAYAAQNNEGWRVVLDGMEGKNYTGVWGITFSPDSKHLAYAARDYRNGKEMQFVVVDGKEGKQYLYDWYAQGILYDPVFSPDGKVVYMANDGGRAEFLVVDETRKMGPWVRLPGTSITFDSSDSFHYLGRDDTGIYLVNINITEKPEEAPCDWTGIWDTWDTDGGFMDLEQEGNSVTGVYTGDVPHHTIQAIVSDKKLVGNWSYSPGSDGGTFEFTMAGDCNSFSGNWRYGSEGDWAGSWNGTRV